MLTPVDLHARHVSALERLGPPLLPALATARPDPRRRTGLRERLARFGCIGLRDRLGTAAGAFAR